MTDLIEEGLLFVGDPYPFEAKLCERFGASRTAVRRVLAQMEGNGLLATVHGKGANRARSPDAHRPAVVLAGLMWGAPPLLQLYRDQREPTTKSGTQ
ncbi:DNA-binding FadR family transcriptional regulator [Streptomyces sp. SAI-195]